MSVWLAVAAPDHLGNPRPEWEDPLTSDDLRQVAESYDPAYRQSSFICGYDPESGMAGPSHFTGTWLPEVSPITAFRWNSTLQAAPGTPPGVLEAETELTPRFRNLVALGWKKPSIGLVKFRDHPSGEAKWYGQHVALVAAGGIEVQAGLAQHWTDEKMRAVSVPEGVKPLLYDGVIELPKEELMAEKKERAAPELEEEKVVAEPEAVVAAEPEAAAEPESDPVEEVREKNRSLEKTVAALAGQVEALVASVGDAEALKQRSVEATALHTKLKKRLADDRETSVKRAVEALAEGDSPRLRSAAVEGTITAVLAMPEEAGDKYLELLRAQDPVAMFLEEEKLDEVPNDLDASALRGFRRTGQQSLLADLAREGGGDVRAAIQKREKEASNG